MGLGLGGWWALRSMPAPVAAGPVTKPAPPEPSRPVPEQPAPSREEPKPAVAAPVQEAPAREAPRPEPERLATAETREPRAQESRKAMVRFVVKPISAWAEVFCGGSKMGETPFEAVQMTVGTHECRFSNPELGTRSRRVEVKPNAPNIVVVQF